MSAKEVATPAHPAAISAPAPEPGAAQAPTDAASAHAVRDIMWGGNRSDEVQQLQFSAMHGMPEERTNAISSLGTKLLSVQQELDNMRKRCAGLETQLCLWSLNRSPSDSSPAQPITYELIEKWVIENRCQQLPHFIQILNRANQIRSLILSKDELVQRVQSLRDLMDTLNTESADLNTHFWKAQQIFGQIEVGMETAIAEDRQRKEMCARVMQERMAAKNALEGKYVLMYKLLQLLVLVQGYSKELSQSLPGAKDADIPASLLRLKEIKQNYLQLALDLTTLCDKGKDVDSIQTQAQEVRKQLADTFNQALFSIRRRRWDLEIEKLLEPSTPSFRQVAWGLLQMLREASLWKEQNREAFNAETLTAQLKSPDNSKSFAACFATLKQKWWSIQIQECNREQAALTQRTQKATAGDTGELDESLIISTDHRESMIKTMRLFALQRQEELKALTDIHNLGASVCTELNRLDGLLQNQATPLKTTQRIVEKFASTKIATMAGYSVFFVWSDPSQAAL